MRFASLFGIGAAFVCAAFLVACGGGGGSAPTAGSSLTGGSLNGSHAASNQAPGTRVTIVIRHGTPKTHARSSTRRGAQTKRSPKYVSQNAEGLQFTVSATGVASQTVYADLTSSSLCNTVSDVTTCVISVPTLAANEQFTALETDQEPINPSSSGYGTGFANGTNILGAISQSETLQIGGANSIGLEIGPVAAFFYDCSYDVYLPTPLPQPYSANYGIDTSGVNGANSGFNAGARIVVTAGVAATGEIGANFGDASESWEDFDTTPAPFVDVNASPVPITLTSNNSALTVAPIVNNGTAPPSTAYGLTASYPNDGYYWYDCYLVAGVQTSASFTSPATITFNNNLTALNPFTSNAYADTMAYTVVPISVSPTSASVSQSGTTYVTATDYGAAEGTDAESTYGTSTSGNYGDEVCKTSGGAVLANVYSNAPINTSNWTQSIEVEGTSSGTGTCTFYVFDLNALTVTKPVTVTVTP